MYKSSRMDKFQSFEKLVHNVNLMYVKEYAWSNDQMEVTFHQIKDQVKVLIILGLHYCLESNDILMAIELHKIHYLSIGPLGIGGILKGVKNLL